MITENEKNVIISEMKDLLDEYDYDYSMSAINKIIDEWSNQKAPLIEAFKKHPNYIEGKFMIAFDADYERSVDKNIVGEFYSWIMRQTYSDGSFLPEEIKAQTIAENCGYLPHKIYCLLSDLHEYNRIISDDFVEQVNKALPQVHAHKGEKTNRVINRICTALNYNTLPDYNRVYAKFADALSPLKIKRHTILSIHPMDYLTMSFGNSWASCHTIDKRNKRGMPNSYEGQYSSGTMSYMLDPSSMVLYTVDKSYDKTEYYTQSKINRQMFHWGEEKLVQGRLYPQSCDCDSEAYAPYRNIVQEIMSTIFDFPNLWIIKRGSNAASEYIISMGTHYEDYHHFNQCTLSRIKGSKNEAKFIVGADPICIECGRRHSVDENISCCASRQVQCCDCGCWIDEDDALYIDDDWYCSDCVTYCESCHEHVPSGDAQYVDGYGDVCDYCLNEYFVYCEFCHSYHHRDDSTWIGAEGSWICYDCLDEHYICCDECGEYYSRKTIHVIEDDRYLCDDCYNDLQEEEEVNENE